MFYTNVKKEIQMFISGETYYYYNYTKPYIGVDRPKLKLFEEYITNNKITLEDIMNDFGVMRKNDRLKNYEFLLEYSFSPLYEKKDLFLTDLIEIINSNLTNNELIHFIESKISHFENFYNSVKEFTSSYSIFYIALKLLIDIKNVPKTKKIKKKLSELLNDIALSKIFSLKDTPSSFKKKNLREFQKNNVFFETFSAEENRIAFNMNRQVFNSFNADFSRLDFDILYDIDIEANKYLTDNVKLMLTGIRDFNNNYVLSHLYKIDPLYLKYYFKNSNNYSIGYDWYNDKGNLNLNTKYNNESMFYKPNTNRNSEHHSDEHEGIINYDFIRLLESHKFKKPLMSIDNFLDIIEDNVLELEFYVRTNNMSYSIGLTTNMINLWIKNTLLLNIDEKLRKDVLKRLIGIIKKLRTIKTKTAEKTGLIYYKNLNDIKSKYNLESLIELGIVKNTDSFSYEIKELQTSINMVSSSNTKELTLYKIMHCIIYLNYTSSEKYNKEEFTEIFTELIKNSNLKSCVTSLRLIKERIALQINNIEHKKLVASIIMNVFNDFKDTEFYNLIKAMRSDTSIENVFNHDMFEFVINNCDEEIAIRAKQLVFKKEMKNTP